jgi:hypothetical protein
LGWRLTGKRCRGGHGRSTDPALKLGVLNGVEDGDSIGGRDREQATRPNVAAATIRQLLSVMPPRHVIDAGSSVT